MEMDYLVLVGLALLDSLSAGTLLIPVVLLIVWRRMRGAEYVTYLGTIVLSYFAVGIALFFGLRQALDAVSGIASNTWFSWVMMVLGILLAAYGILAPNPKKRTVEEVIESRSEDTKKGSAGLPAMVGLALAAAVVEVGTMLPYLAAIGIIESMAVPFAVQLLILALYCVVMILPAVIVGVLFAAFGDKVYSRVVSVIPRLEYETKVTVLWVAAIIGIVLVAWSANQLGFIG